MASDKEDTSWKATALAIAMGAFLASSLFRKDKPDAVSPQRQTITAGAVFKLFVEAVTVLLLLITAKIQYDSFLVQQGRPFLSVEFGDIRPPASGEKIDGLDTVELTYSIKNSGNVPAFQVRGFCLASIADKHRLGININKRPSSAQISEVPKDSIEDKNGEAIIPAQGTGNRTFLMPVSLYQEFLDSSRKMDDGLAVRVDYAGPWGKQGDRPYFFQTRMIPWRDGKFIRFKINQTSGN